MTRRNNVNNFVAVVVAALLLVVVLVVVDGRRLMAPTAKTTTTTTTRSNYARMVHEQHNANIQKSLASVAKKDQKQKQPQQKQEQRRQMLQSDAPSRWDECVTQGLTGSECETLILNSVGGDLSNHPIPNLQIKINKQRDSSSLEKTKSMFGVASTLTGETDCDLYDGDSVYPFDYIDENGTSHTIPNISCKGKPVLECCDEVLNYMESNNIPTTDIDGNCFTCWIYQHPLEPMLDVETGSINYVEHTYNSDTDTCDEIIYNAAEVAAIDDVVTSALTSITGDIQSMIDMGNESKQVDCIDVTRLIDDVHYFGRSYPIAMTLISTLFCNQCTAGGSIMLTETQITDLSKMKSVLLETHDSAENCIVIYTDATGDNILKVPQVGGSLNDELPPAPVDPVDVIDEDDPEPEDTPDQIGCPPGQMDDPSGNGCMCEAITEYEDLESFWTPGSIQPTGNNDSCSCPSSLFSEFNNRCWCKGGFKLYNPLSKQCECPYGINPNTNNCACPHKPTDVDLGWNQVGWIPSTGFNGQAGCKVDENCSKSEFDDYESFGTGCNICASGRIESDDGTMCILPCDESKGYKYDPSVTKDKCVCIDEENMTEIQNMCQCTDSILTLNVNSGKCECPNTKYTNLPQTYCFDFFSETYYCTTYCPADYYGYDSTTTPGNKNGGGSGGYYFNNFYY